MTRALEVQNALTQLNGGSNLVLVHITYEIRTMDDGYVVKEVIRSETIPEETRH